MRTWTERGWILIGSDGYPIARSFKQRKRDVIIPPITGEYCKVVKAVRRWEHDPKRTAIVCYVRNW